MALREVFARFGVEVEGQDKVRRLDADTTKAAKGLEATGKQAEKTGQSFTALASGIAAAFAGNQLLGAIKNFAGELDVLDDLNAQTGIATDQLQVLGYAAELNGSSAAEMIGPGKQRRVARVAAYYLAARSPAFDECRFDVVAITAGEAILLKDAFRLRGR